MTSSVVLNLHPRLQVPLTLTYHENQIRTLILPTYRLDTSILSKQELATRFSVRALGIESNTREHADRVVRNLVIIVDHVSSLSLFVCLVCPTLYPQSWQSGGQSGANSKKLVADHVPPVI